MQAIACPRKVEALFGQGLTLKQMALVSIKQRFLAFPTWIEKPLFHRKTIKPCQTEKTGRDRFAMVSSEDVSNPGANAIVVKPKLWAYALSLDGEIKCIAKIETYLLLCSSVFRCCLLAVNRRAPTPRTVGSIR